MFGSISGGHFNPVVSVMLALRGDEQVNTGMKLAYVIGAQVLGGMSAFYVRKMLVK
jgi:glycerol uptake facilitator-like aquaporin